MSDFQAGYLTGFFFGGLFAVWLWFVGSRLLEIWRESDRRYREEWEIREKARREAREVNSRSPRRTDGRIVP